MQKLLSKSKYLNGLQCPKLLWISVNDKTKMPEVDESTQKLFDQGQIVGEFAKKLFPEGINIPVKDFNKNLTTTKELLTKNKPLFEPAFLINRLYSRADILEPTNNGWNIIEVKSSTEVKEVNIQDVAFQRYVYEKAGLKIDRCYLLHINNKYVRHDEINPKELFTKEDITIPVNEELKFVDDRIIEMLEIIDSKEPNTTISKNCKEPYECQMKELCWSFLPKENSVFDLYRGGKNSWELFNRNILSIKDIPEDFKLNDKQQIQFNCERTNEPHINKNAITKFLKDLKYPLYFLDFETYQTAIPLYDGLKPYQQIPFQFSVHKINSKGKKTHYSFIASGKKDPRKKFLNAIKRKLGVKGSIIIYNQSFEQSRLKEIGDYFPEEKETVNKIISRMIDLLIPFRNFDYYNRKQEGSASIKYVLPAMCSLSYSGMEIANGSLASIRYAYITHGGAKLTEIRKVRDDLKKYCSLDTEAMVVILEELKKYV